MAQLDWTKAELMEVAKSVGLYVATYGPGDGVTRYRFFRSTVPVDYFGGSWAEQEYTALGITEARTYLAGYQRGYHNAHVNS